jgi:precorrin-6Y C5,15-methyltransferase (decarboxylating)
MPEAEIVIYPTFNSLQMLAHRLVMPYHDMRIVSLTGRPWPEFDKALIERAEKIGVLTDKEHTPATIAQRMLDYGYSNYSMSIGEHLGHPALEKVTILTLEEATQRNFDYPNCVIVTSPNPSCRRGNDGCGVTNSSCRRGNDGCGVTNSSCRRGNDGCGVTNSSCRRGNDGCGVTNSSCRRGNDGCGVTPPPTGGVRGGHPFGLPDNAFTLLDGRSKMITKMPIRLLTLQALDLPCRHVFWDIGFCTGSVSIEARLQFPHLHIEAFEIRPECEAIIHENARRFGAPGINVHIGDFLETDISPIPRPDAVFIGGHGGKLKEIMSKVLTCLAPDGVIVFNSVTSPKVPTDSRLLWDEACRELGLTQEPPMRIVIDEHHPIQILKCKR